MKNRSCPNKDVCWYYEVSNCEGCATGEKIARLARQNKKLKAENAELSHRAEVAERALKIVCRMQENLNILVDGKPWTKEEIYNRYIKQAKRELAEEGKDG